MINLNLLITYNCNLNCTYCKSDRCTKKMPIEIALKAIDLTLPNSGDLSINFYGGEPMIEKDNVLRIMRYALKNRRKGQNISFSMTTNGTLIDEEFLKRANQFHLNISFSHDGVFHDLQRLDRRGKGSHERLWNNLRLWMHHQPESTVMCTYTPDTIYRLSETLDWFKDLGITNVSLNPDYHRSDWNEDVLNDQYSNIIDGYLKTIEIGANFHISNIDRKVFDILHGNKKCVLSNTSITVNVDGEIYPCLSFCGMKEYRIGSVDTGIDMTSLKDIHTAAQVIPERCMVCDVQRYCSNQCACIRYISTNTLAENSYFHCAHERCLIDSAQRIIEQERKLYREKANKRSYMDECPIDEEG